MQVGVYGPPVFEDRPISVHVCVYVCVCLCVYIDNSYQYYLFIFLILARRLLLKLTTRTTKKRECGWKTRSGGTISPFDSIFCGLMLIP